MDVIDCKVRVDAYFRNMNLYENGNEIRVRFLDKIFRAAIDENYTFEEQEMVLQMLLDDAKATHNTDYKFLDLCYCYKIKKIINSSIDVPIIKSDTQVRGSRYDYRELPEGVKQTLIERGNKITLAFHESTKPDREALELYNVYISKDHFYHKGMRI